MQTYVMHYKPLKQRRLHIESELAKQGITDYNFVEEYDQEDLTEEIIDKYYDKSPKRWAQIADYTGDGPYRELSLASISLNMKHLTALEKFLGTDDEHCLVLEDDCVFNVISRSIENIILDAPDDWDIIFLGGGFSLKQVCRVVGRIGRYALVDHPATNTTSSFIYNTESARKTLQKLSPFSLPIDWQLNYVFKENQFKVYHLRPYMCSQISGKTKGFESTS